MLDVIGGDILDRSAVLVRAGGTLVTTVIPPKVQPRDGRLKPVVGAVRPLPEAPDALTPGKRTPGKTIIRVTPS